MRQTLIRRYLISTSIRLNTANTSKPTETVNTGVSQAGITASLPKEGAKRSLSQIEQIYMNKIKERNDERFLKEKKLKLHYRITGSLLVLIVLSVYSYTMFAIRQEKFLDDFDVPEPPDQTLKTLKNKQ